MHCGNWFEEIGWAPNFLFCPLRTCGYRRVPTTASLRFDDVPVEAGCSALTVPENPLIHIDARSVETEFRATPITKVKAVQSVVEKFREKYGAKDVKKFYSEIRCGGQDVAVMVELG